MVSRAATALLLLSTWSALAFGAAPQQTSDAWAGAIQLRQFKSEFVAALREFAEAASGSYGDEGRLLVPRLDALARTLDAWDRGVAAYETAARSAAPTADSHAALGSAYLDRSRVDDAVREFDRAIALDGRREDIHEMAAMAYALAGDTRRAFQELENASAINPDNPATLYRLAQALADTESPRKVDVQRRLDAVRPTSALGQPDAPLVQFDRIALVRQAAGVAPIFPPARYVRAFRAIDSGRYADGLDLLRRAVVDDPLLAGATSAASSRPCST